MTYAELLGDLVQPWATRSSQCITDAPFQLGVDEGATAMLARGLGPVYLTGGSASQSAARVGASTSRVVVSTAPLNGSNGRDLDLPLISDILTPSRRS